MEMWIQIEVADGTSMKAYLALPESVAKRPGLLLFQEAFGVNSHIRELCSRFAADGYVTIAPELYHRTAPGFEGRYDNFPAIMPHMSALTPAGLEADIRATHQALVAREDVDSSRIASIGFCMGGRVSFLADALLPLRASVSFYGGGIAPSQTGPGLLDRAGNLHAPILMFWGGLDKHIGIEQPRAVADALRSANKPYVNVEISDADHGFYCDQRGSHNPKATAEARALTLAFLKQHLAS